MPVFRASIRCLLPLSNIPLSSFHAFCGFLAHSTLKFSNYCNFPSFLLSPYFSASCTVPSLHPSKSLIENCTLCFITVDRIGWDGIIFYRKSKSPTAQAVSYVQHLFLHLTPPNTCAAKAQPHCPSRPSSSRNIVPSSSKSSVLHQCALDVSDT